MLIIQYKSVRFTFAISLVYVEYEDPSFQSRRM